MAFNGHRAQQSHGNHGNHGHVPALWEDFQADINGVEWGGDAVGAVYPVTHEHHRGTRRVRALNHPSKKSNGILVAAMASSLAVAIILASLVSVNVMNAPSKNEGGDKLEGVVPSPITSTTSTPFPSQRPSSIPSLTPTASLRPSHYPTETGTPTSSPSRTPSDIPSTIPSASTTPSSLPSSLPTTAVQKSPPLPPTSPTSYPTNLHCTDLPGYHANHADENVTCLWFQIVGSYAYERNCGKTPVGKACMKSCMGYNGNECTEQPSSSPSLVPTSNPPSSIPSMAPTNLPTTSPTVTPPKSITMMATGDATIRQSLPNANLGSASWIKIDIGTGGSGGEGEYHSLIQFDLSSVSSHGDYNDYNDFNPLNPNRAIQSASLRLRAASNCPSGGYLERTKRTMHSDWEEGWEEDSVTWANAPEGDGVVIGRVGQVGGSGGSGGSGAIQAGYWYEVDVTVAVLALQEEQEQWEQLEDSGIGEAGGSAKSILSLRLFPDNGQDGQDGQNGQNGQLPQDVHDMHLKGDAGGRECLYYSKENDSADAPELHIVYVG